MIVVRSATYSISLSLCEIMIDVMPCCLEALEQVEQVLGVAVVERRGGLVEDEQLHVLRERLRDLDELLLAHAKLADGRGGVLVEAHPVHQLGGLVIGAVPVDEAKASAPLVAEEDVLGHREVRDQRELLVNDDDASALGIVDAAELGLLRR